MSWHMDEQSLARYAAGQAGAVSAASTEAHLTSCELCRTRLAPAVPGERLAGIWDEVAERVDAGNLPWFERVLVRVGVREDTARLLAATPSLGTAWLTAVAAAVVFAVAASDTSPRGLFLYLTLAPMLPVAGVAAAYGRHADPAYELAVASPYSMLRLLLVRSVAVVGSTLVLTAAGGVLLAGAGWQAAGWLLPALALSVLTLVLSARVAPVWAATGLLGAWVTTVFAAWRGTDSPVAAFGPAGQAVAAAVVVTGVLVLYGQRTLFAFDTRRSA